MSVSRSTPSTAPRQEVRDILLEFGQWLADNPIQRDALDEAFVMDEPDEYVAVIDAFLEKP